MSQECEPALQRRPRESTAQMLCGSVLIKGAVLVAQVRHWIQGHRRWWVSGESMVVHATSLGTGVQSHCGALLGASEGCLYRERPWAVMPCLSPKVSHHSPWQSELKGLGTELWETSCDLLTSLLGCWVCVSLSRTP